MQTGEESRHTILRHEVNNMEPPENNSGGTQILPPIPLRNVEDDPRWWEILNRRKKSSPCSQFEAQREQERQRLLHQLYERDRGRIPTLPESRNSTREENAYSNVRRRWEEQGIWDGDWGYEPSHLWKHEMEPEPKIEDGMQPNEQRATHERGTVASRPYHQFVYQLAREREWIADDIPFDQIQPDTIAAAARLRLHGKPLEKLLYQGVDKRKLTGDKRTDDMLYFHHNLYDRMVARWIEHGALDLHEMAYKAVKARWMEQEIWDRVWVEMPGMEWHMCSVEDEYRALVSTKEKPPNEPRPGSFDFAKPQGPVHNPSSSPVRGSEVWTEDVREFWKKDWESTQNQYQTKNFYFDVDQKALQQIFATKLSDLTERERTLMRYIEQLHDGFGVYRNMSMKHNELALSSAKTVLAKSRELSSIAEQALAMVETNATDGIAVAKAMHDHLLVKTEDVEDITAIMSAIQEQPLLDTSDIFYAARTPLNFLPALKIKSFHIS